MEINWVTLTAQVVNFLVLLWLLKHFLYGRIVKAMREREEKIAARLDEAAKVRSQAEAEAKIYRDKNRDLDDQKEQLFAKAKDEAEALRVELIEKARADVESIQNRWYEALSQEKDAAEHEFRRQLAERVLAALRRILKELAHAELEQRMLEVFFQRLAHLNAAEGRAFEEALSEAKGHITVRTSHELPPDSRERLATIIRDRWGRNVAPHFEIAPELLCGLELHVHSQRLTWNVEHYLEEVEREFFQALSAKVNDANHSRRQDKDNHHARSPEKRP